MPNKKYVGTFHSIDTVLYKITELEAQGCSKREMYAVSKVKDDLEMLRADAEIHLLDAGNRRLLDHTQELFNEEEQVIGLLVGLGFSEQRARVYYEDMKDGGVALFVDGNVTDSGMERGLSGESSDVQEKFVDSEETVPRINTTNL